ncbi:efflux RND transporter periplasmic adaptor subunit [Parachitinimonas caeni]|uniref:Efflux RND transporter periplasmic adaptor subunit n=1 Tax=Parachitinimonas caeni TaxID=3031301 RepID=A0ABT7E584_9NEIS|nr:efflux RND transporter periplasmic adaptor subunit [Parachitinimonas caeni]MDK2126610.1 efflux RND transporter periplasmic adaptor subunit [Parachitinimonas caeni]
MTPQTQSKRSLFSRKTIWLALAGALLIGGFAMHRGQTVSAASKDNKKPEPPAVLELSSTDLAKAALGELRQSIALSGTLSPVNQTRVNAEVDGVVAEVLVRPGDQVKRGQVLARIETADLNNQVKTQSANLERSRAELALAEKNRDRSANLLKQNFISPNSHDSAENALIAARAAVKADEARLAVAGKALQDAVVKAPFDGFIAERTAQPGQRIGINAPLFSLVDLKELEFEANLPVSSLGAVKIGQELTLRVEGFGDRQFGGHVERINPTAQAGSRMIPIYIRIANPKAELRGGMFAQSELTLQKASDAVTLPMLAIRGLEQKQPLALVVKDGKLIERKLKLGLISETTQQAQVLEGLAAGEQVVIAKLASLKPGQQVKLPAPPPPAPKS